MRVRQIYETIDRQPYQWVVVLVAGIGFFLDGYTVRDPSLDGALSAFRHVAMAVRVTDFT